MTDWWSNYGLVVAGAVAIASGIFTGVWFPQWKNKWLLVTGVVVVLGVLGAVSVGWATSADHPGCV